MAIKINMMLSTKQIRVLLLSLIKSGLNNFQAKKLKRLFKKILKDTTGNWWTL